MQDFGTNEAVIDLDAELRRTSPDHVVFAPTTLDPSSGITGNEHFLVSKLDSGELFALWTQSSLEGAPDQHLVVSFSRDDGDTWTDPRTIAGGSLGRMASWGFPLISRSGRIYVVFNQHTGVNDIFTHTTGEMAVVCSSDGGASWSTPSTITMPRSIWDNPDVAVPANWIVWQKPLRQSDDKYFVGFTRWVSPSSPEKGSSSVVEFMRFENVDHDPAPEDLQITFIASDERALHVTGDLQEPTIVSLPDGRLFCVMRSSLGSPFWSQSSDEGLTWSSPLPLLQHDNGPVLQHPLSPCPAYQLSPNECVFFFHNHDGHFMRFTPEDLEPHRRPIWLTRGVFQPSATQPVWFSDPFAFMDSGGVRLVREGMSLYASVTEEQFGLRLWYPDRKFFLLGRRLDLRQIRGLRVPRPGEATTRFALGGGGE